jgi:hypothetical protein
MGASNNLKEGNANKERIVGLNKTLFATLNDVAFCSRKCVAKGTKGRSVKLD